jgi:hypothetical protein
VVSLALGVVVSGSGGKPIRFFIFIPDARPCPHKLGAYKPVADHEVK